MMSPLISPLLSLLLVGVIAVAGGSLGVLVPVAVMAILVTGMAVALSKLPEEEMRAETSKPHLMSVVSGSMEQDTAGSHSHMRRDVARAIEAAVEDRPRALIIGSGLIAQALRRNLESVGGYTVVGFVDDVLAPESDDGPRVLGGRATASSIIREYGVNAVFIASPPSWQQSLAESVVSENPSVSVNVVPSCHEALMRLNRVSSCGDIALVSLTPSTERLNEVLKRAVDVLSATIGLILLSPLLLVIGIIIKLNSPGPVIFYQKRVGRHGTPFMLYKLRTMVMDAEANTGPVLVQGKSDARLTRVGRFLRMFRIDELPQLFNVIRGDMSLVGPRPERPFFVEKFQKRLPAYSKRHQLRPGITGLAQVYGGYHTDAEDKLRFDLIYISQQSLWLDFTILLRTILVICKPDR